MELHIKDGVLMKLKFNFYLVYLNDLNKLNAFQFKKVVNALVKYMEKRIIPQNLSKKGFDVFVKIMPILDLELKEYVLSMARSLSHHLRAECAHPWQNHQPRHWQTAHAFYQAATAIRRRFHSYRQS